MFYYICNGRSIVSSVITLIIIIIIIIIIIKKTNKWDKKLFEERARRTVNES